MAVASASLSAARGIPWRVWWLYLLVLSLPFFGFSFFNLSYRGLLRADWLFAGLLVLAFGLRVLAGAKVRVGVTGIFVVALHVAALLSALNLFNATNDQVIDFLTFYSQLVLMSLLFFAMSNMKMTDGQLRNVIRAWLFIAALAGSYAVYEVIAVNLNLPLLPLHFTNPSVKEIGTGSAILWDFRAGSFLAEPGYLGSILIAPLVILTFLLVYGRSREVLFRSTWMNWTTWVIIAGAVIVAQSMGAYIVLLAVGLLVLGRFWRRRQALWRLAFAGGMLFLVVMLAAFLTRGSQYEITERLAQRVNNITQGRDGSMQVRAARTIVALQVWANHPVLGVGLNNLAQGAAGIAPPVWYGGREPLDKPGAMMWTGVLAEMGVVGFLAGAGVWASMLRRLGRAARLVGPVDYLSVIMIALFYVLLTDVMYLLFGGSLVEPQRWFDLGLASLWLAHWRARQQSARLPANADLQ